MSETDTTNATKQESPFDYILPASWEELQPINFPPLSNDTVMRVLAGKHTEYVPVWAMRQAGRYLPEFRQVRAEADFFKVCRTPHLACEVTLQPIRRFNLDASIIFSDILVVPQALGLDVKMIPGVGPTLSEPLVTPDDMKRLRPMTELDDIVASLSYVSSAITLTRHRLKGKVPLIGFCGGPWTLMSYMIEGGGSKTFEKSKKWLFRHPEESHQLLSIITSVLIPFLIDQIKAGAQVLQVFESHAGELDNDSFLMFVFPKLNEIALGVKNRCKSENIICPPLILFSRNSHTNDIIQNLALSSYDALSVDWAMTGSQVRHIVDLTCANNNKSRIILQGNLDPIKLFGSINFIKEQVKLMIHSFGTDRYIANLGHGMMPTHDPAHLEAFINAVHDISKEIIMEKYK